MKNGIVVFTVVVFLAASGLVLSKMMGISGGCCSTHQTHENK